ncbi:MAG: hypothetical protein JNK79_06295 [Chitinophagaceae bacterium]|nr:hypothetical protein [Chitinophagaceae bacterium]
MKNDVVHASAHVDRFILDNLMQVKETIARIEVKKSKEKRFGTTDLWNIRRKAKFASSTFNRYTGL